MAQQTNITGDHNPVQISTAPGFTLEAPGIICTVVEKDKTTETTRGGGAKDLVHQKIMNSIGSNEVHLLNQFEIEVTGHNKENQNTTRGGGKSTDEAEMILNTPKTHKGMSCAVMHIDEEGECKWIFPKQETEKQFSFALPKEEVRTEALPVASVRGAITMGIRRIVKVFAWLTDGIVGAAALAGVKNWEETHRPYGLSAISAQGEGGEIEWSLFEDKPSLLLLHGTFSTWESAFDGLFKDEIYQDLYKKYEGRILAFNHPSLHHSPAENIQQLFKMIPKGVNLNVDIVTHSRGGLVGRELIERYDEYDNSGVNIKVNKAIFVAAPNQGTILTDRDNWVKLIDCYTNLVTTLPDNVGTIILESVITLVKVVGGGAVKGLPGLQAMLPKGDHIKRLNNTHKVETTYYAIGANYAPNDEKLLARYGKRLLMRVLAKVFGEDSDMVVPTSGSFTTGKDNGGFPIPKERQKLYMLEQDVNHCNYFTHHIVNKTLMKWLAG